jgi:peptidoglycan hydrolase CwlO-like protein
MIDKKISLGTILTGVTIIGTFIFTQGSTQTKIENVEKEQINTIKTVKKNESDITNLKVSVAKIETQLDNRFDRLEEILMDLE